MITKHTCDKVEETPWKDKIKECCDKEDPNDPKGCDCCYDTWTEELREVNSKFSQAGEQARQVSMDLTYVSERRSKLKIWYDELTEAHDLAQHICDQLEIIQDQTEKVAQNTKYAIKAIKILFCMVRDFYMQVDSIKTRYDQIYTCIRCLNDPVLVPGQGIMKCLEDYGKKLEEVIATRDELVKMVMTAIYTAYRINRNLNENFGLHMVIGEWQITFNCDEECGVGEASCRYGRGGSEEDEGQIKCNLAPRLMFPICNDPYYEDIKDKYEADKKSVAELAQELIELNKRKESLLACKNSLVAAIKEVDPKIRCN